MESSGATPSAGRMCLSRCPPCLAAPSFPLDPIDDCLLARGFVPRGPFIMIEGWAVEFVPPGTPLVEEALVEAVERDVNGVATRVFTAEHLAAICLEVGRTRDHDRVSRFIGQKVLDGEKFEPILRRHGLLEKWRKFQQEHPEP